MSSYEKTLPVGLFGTKNTIVVDIASFDVNQDGYIDFVMSETGSEPFYQGVKLQILINDRAGGFRDETESRIGQTNGSWAQYVKIGDFNNDGYNDILAQSDYGDPDQQIMFWINRGNGTFSALPTSSLATFSGTIVPLDFNKDGRMDFLSFEREGGWNGTGQWNFKTHMNTNSSAAEVFRGTSDDDTLTGGAGNDTLDGGVGRDTATFSGGSFQYRLGIAGKTLTVSGPDGTDTLTNVELLKFEHGAIDVSSLTGAAPENAIYRFYNNATGTHFYTNQMAERDSVLNTLTSFSFEGVAFGSTEAGGHSVWRFYNSQTGTHFYTISDSERDHIQKTLPQYQFEGEAYQASADPAAGLDPLYRFYNTHTGAHFFTASLAERDAVASTLPQFKYEGVGYYVDLM